MNAVTPIITRTEKKTAIALALLWMTVSMATAGEIYVDAVVFPEEADGTAERPYATIQVAVDKAKDGETIVGNDSTLGNRTGGGLWVDSTQVYLVDCDILHCCARTGVGLYKGTAVRCRIDDCYGLTSVAAREAVLFNCIVTHRSRLSPGRPSVSPVDEWFLMV